jgi:transcriptional regulator with XRE-family HTH domain
MSDIEELAADVLARTEGDIATLRQLVDRLDHELSADPLERTARLWDVSNAQLARMFGVSRQAVSKWLRDGPPAARQPQVALLGQVTELLDRWIKRERIAAVVRRPVETLGGRSRLEVALAGEFEQLRDELRDTFDLTRVAP